MRECARKRCNDVFARVNCVDADSLGFSGGPAHCAIIRRQSLLRSLDRRHIRDVALALT